MNVGQIFVELGLKDGTFKAGLKGAQAQAKGFGTTLKGSLATGAAMAASTIGFQGIGEAIKGTIGAGLGMNSQLEQNQVAFQVLLGDADAASKVIKNLYEYAATTPFEFPEIANAARTLQTVGLEGDKVIKWVGDLAAANPQATIGEVSSAIARLKSGSFGEAFERLREFGIAKKDLEGAGLVFDKGGSYKGSIDDAMTAVEGIIKKKYGGMADAQSKTFGGMISTIKDSINMTLGSAFKPMFDDLKARMPGIISVMGQISEGFKTGGLKGALDAVLPKETVDKIMGALSALNGVWDSFWKGLTGSAKVGNLGDTFKNVLSFITQLAVAIKPIAGTIGVALGAAFTVIMGVFSFIAKNGAVIVPIIKAVLVGFLAFKVVSGILTGIQVAMALVNLVMMMNPIGLVIAAIAAAAFLVVKYWGPISEFFKGIWEAIKGPALALWDGIKAVWTAVWDGITWFFQTWGTTILGFILGPIVPLVGFLTTHWEAIKQGVFNAWGAITAFFQKWGGVILVVVLGPLGMLINLIRAHWDQIKAGAMAVWNGITAFLGAVWNGYKALATAQFNAIKTVVTTAWNAIKTVTTTAWNAVKSTVVGLWDSMVSTIKSKISGFTDIGRAIADGIRNGVSNAWSALTDKLKKLVGLLPQIVKDMLGIASPSRVMAGLGKQIPAGIAQGVTNGMGVVRSAMAGLIDMTTGSVGVDLGMGSMTPAMAGGGGSSTSIVIQAGAIQVSGVSDPDAVAERILSELRRRGVKF